MYKNQSENMTNQCSFYNTPAAKNNCFVINMQVNTNNNKPYAYPNSTMHDTTDTIDLAYSSIKL